MTSNYKKLSFALIASFLIHIFILIAVLYYTSQKLYQIPEEDVIELEFTKPKNLKIADILPPKDPRRPDKAKFLGMYNSRVQEERVAVNRQRAEGRPKTRGGKGIQNLKEKLFKDKVEEGIHFQKEDPLDKRIAENKAEIPEDFYPGIKIGPRTNINVLEHPDSRYVVRLKRVFKLAWDPFDIVRTYLYRGVLKKPVISSSIKIIINSDGTLDEIYLVKKSGFDEYDKEAIRTVKASAPFSSPPDNLLKEGVLELTWGFVLYIR